MQHTAMQRDIDRVLIDRLKIAHRVQQVAGEITRDLAAVAPGDASAVTAPSNPEPPEITLVPIMTGSIIFVADLIRHLPLRMKIRLISVSSYAGATTTSKGAILEQSLTN